MGASEIMAGSAVVEVGIKDQIAKGLKSIEGRLKKFGTGVSTIGASLAAVGGGAMAFGAGMVVPLLAATKVFADYGSQVKDAADRTGISASAISELGYAAEQGGADLATLESSVRKMQKGIVAGAEGSQEMQSAFAGLGLSVKDLASLSPEEQFDAVSKAIGGISDPTERAAKAMQIFGKSGTQLLPMLSSDIAALRKEARDMGISLNDVDAGNAEALGDSFSKVEKTLRGIGLQVGAALAGPIAMMAETVAYVVSKVTDWMRANRGVVQTIAAIGAGLVVAGAVATGLGVVIMGVGATITALGVIAGSIVGIAVTAFGVLASAIGFLLSPVGLVIAAIVGIGAYAVYAALTATDALGKLSGLFGSLGDIFSTSWGGIVAAISSGDFETAGEIAFLALEMAWLSVTTTMRQVWASVSDFFVNMWLSAVESIVHFGAAIYFGVAKYFDLLSNALVAGFDIAVTYILGTIDSIQNAIAKVIIKAGEFFGMFSKEQSMQIQASLDKDLERRAAGRQTKLDQGASERGSRLNKNEAERRATADQFGQIVGEDFKRRKTTVVDPRMAESEAKLKEMRDRLGKTSEKAIANAAEKAAAESQVKPNGMDQLAEAANARTAKQTKLDSTGSFSASAALAISQGGGNAADETARNTRQMVALQQRMLKKRDKVGVAIT